MAPSPIARLTSSVRRYTDGLPRAFWTLWAGTLVNRLGTFVQPFLALYLTAERGLSTEGAAVVVAGYGAGAFGASLAGGWLADRAGRRATLLLSLTGGAAAMAAVPFVRAPLALGLALAGLGFLVELYRPAVAAAVADLVSPEDRPRAYALLLRRSTWGPRWGPCWRGSSRGARSRRCSWSTP